MAGPEMAAPMAKGVMSAAGGGGGGKGGGGGGGGVSPEQKALAQYTFGQNLLKARSAFGSSGMGMSTGETQTVGGAQIAEGEQLEQMANNNDKIAQQQNQQQSGGLNQLAGDAGFGAGTSGGGSSSGSFGSTS